GCGKDSTATVPARDYRSAFTHAIRSRNPEDSERDRSDDSRFAHDRLRDHRGSRRSHEAGRVRFRAETYRRFTSHVADRTCSRATTSSFGEHPPEGGIPESLWNS